MSTRNSKNSRAFTLLEVLVALGILAVAAIAITGGFGSSNLASRRAESVSVATMLARQKMAEEMIRIEKNAAEGKFPDTNEESNGTFDEPYDRYQWEIKIRKVEIPVPPQGEQGVQAQLTQMIAKQIGEALREVKLVISWEEEEKKDVTVVTHVVKK